VRDFLGFDPAELDWTYLYFDFLLRVEASDSDLDEDGRREVLNDIEQACVGAGRALSEIMRRRAGRILESAGLTADQKSLFPWLTWPDRDIRF
jgi:hypothetical protein